MTELTYGDTVRVLEHAPPASRPGEIGSVVALPAPGRTTVTVEFGDGSSAGVEVWLLEKIAVK